MNTRGISLVELLIALAILGIGFTAMLYSQLGSLKASSRSKITSTVKAAATQVLQAKLAEVLVVKMNDTSAIPAGSTNQIGTETLYIDTNSATVFGRAGVKQSFMFTDYYWNCPTPQTPSVTSGIRTDLRAVTCSGTQAVDGINVSWSIQGQSGFTGEGVLDIVVTATASNQNISLTLGNRVSCYDIYPAPSSNAPAPCPNPGQGRS